LLENFGCTHILVRNVAIFFFDLFDFSCDLTKNVS